MKKFILIVFTFIVSSCNLLNTNNFKNDYRWKNRKFKTSQNASLQFKPKLIKIYDDDSYFLKKYFKTDSQEMVNKFNKELVKDLEKEISICHPKIQNIKFQ